MHESTIIATTMFKTVCVKCRYRVHMAKQMKVYFHIAHHTMKTSLQKYVKFLQWLLAVSKIEMKLKIKLFMDSFPYQVIDSI